MKGPNSGVDRMVVQIRVCTQSHKQGWQDFSQMSKTKQLGLGFGGAVGTGSRDGGAVHSQNVRQGGGWGKTDQMEPLGLSFRHPVKTVAGDNGGRWWGGACKAAVVVRWHIHET